MSRKISKSPPTVTQTRENHILDLLHEIASDHAIAGFNYRDADAEGISLRSPVHIEFKHWPDDGNMYPKPKVYFDGSRIIIDLWQLYELPALIDDVMGPGSDDDEDLLVERNSLKKILGNVRHLYAPTSKQTLRQMLSEALGGYLVSRLLKKHPASWLNEETLVTSIVRGGMQKCFYYFYREPSPQVSASVWQRFDDDSTSRSTFWSCATFRETAGCALALPILRDFGRAGFEEIIQNAIVLAVDGDVSCLPEYFDRLFTLLSERPY